MQLSKVVFGLNLESSIILGKAATAYICTGDVLTPLRTFQRSELKSEQSLSTWVSSGKAARDNNLLAPCSQPPRLDPTSQSISIR